MHNTNKVKESDYFTLLSLSIKWAEPRTKINEQKIHCFI